VCAVLFAAPVHFALPAIPSRTRPIGRHCFPRGDTSCLSSHPTRRMILKACGRLYEARRLVKLVWCSLIGVGLSLTCQLTHQCLGEGSPCFPAYSVAIFLIVNGLVQFLESGQFRLFMLPLPHTVETWSLPACASMGVRAAILRRQINLLNLLVVTTR
jgi:hypothetical protein